MLRMVKGLLTTGAVICAMVVGGSAPAWAASEGPPVEPSVAEVEATTTTSAVGELTAEDQEFLAAANEFHCTLTIQYPHASTHVSGTVNVVGDVTCPITMREMYLRIYLEKSGGGSWAGTPWTISTSPTSREIQPLHARTRPARSAECPPRSCTRPLVGRRRINRKVSTALGSASRAAHPSALLANRKLSRSICPSFVTAQRSN
jgi:hypothetical protein